MTQLSETELIAALQNAVLQISFRAVDGTDRVMCCTLHESLMPVWSNQSTTPPKKSGVVTVYSTDRAGWRSVKPESITDVSIVQEL